MKSFVIDVLVLLLVHQCMVAATYSETTGVESQEECALLQGTRFRHKGNVKKCEGDCCVLIITTPGAEYPCCGCPKPDAPDCGCGLLNGTDMHDMAAAFAKGVRNASDCQVEIADISKEGGCPDFDLVKGFDAIILAAPSYNSGVAPDMKTFWHRFDKHGMDGLSCKVGAAITRNGAYYTGAQPTLEELHRMMLMRQMIIAAGPNWNTGEGAAAMIGQWPFFRDAAVDDIFLTESEAYGARIGNLTKAMKNLTSRCGSDISGTKLAHADPYYALLQPAARRLLSRRSAAGKNPGTCESYGCADGYVEADSCQCNSKCGKHENCCPDYEDKCVDGARPVPDGAPEWPGWSGQQGDSREPPYVEIDEGNWPYSRGLASLYDTNFSWVDPSCGDAPVESKVIIITTPGANGYKGGPCCGCPEPDTTIWPGNYPKGTPGPGNPSGRTRCGCFKHTGDRTLQMAQAIRFGFQNTTGGCAKSGVQVDIFDISENTTGKEAGCPTWDDVKDYDLYIFGSPSWNGLPSSDIISYTNLFPLKETDMRCKAAAGFSTGGGYQAGAQSVVESLKRIAMTFQMFWIGGPQWNIGEGAVANTGTWPFFGSTERADGEWDMSVSPLFLNDAWGLGARLANLTMSGGLKALTSLCGDFPGLEDAERR